MAIEILIAFLFVSVVGGLACARLNARRRSDRLTASRLARWLRDTAAVKPVPVLTGSLTGPRRGELLSGLPILMRLNAWFNNRLALAGFSARGRAFLSLSLLLMLLPPAAAFALDCYVEASLAVGVAAATLPFVWVVWAGNARRIRFCEQLPDAMDLMVSVLRSGHSVSQAVKAVAEEMPDPVGAEFAQVVQRMNLGQPLSEALSYTCARFRSFELDLIRRAVTVQAEVGGSLAELLDKTNQTLRARLKLVRQVRVLTAQSRLTALIVGLLPLVLGMALNAMSPGYLQPLFSTETGKMLLMLAVGLEVIGLFVMRRLSTVRV